MRLGERNTPPPPKMLNHFQAVGTMPDVLTASKDIGVIGFLSAAVVALWKNARVKDDSLLKRAETVTAAMVTNTTSNTELRKVIEETEQSKVELAQAMRELTVELRAKPCLVDCQMVNDYMEQKWKRG